MMTTHQDLASRMMDAMGADMPGLATGPLTTRMQAHIARMRRMMAIHEGMMKM